MVEYFKLYATVFLILQVPNVISGAVLSTWLCYSNTNPTEDGWRLDCGGFEGDEVSEHYMPWAEDEYPLDLQGYAVVASSNKAFYYDTVSVDNTYPYALCESDVGFTGCAAEDDLMATYIGRNGNDESSCYRLLHFDTPVRYDEAKTQCENLFNILDWTAMQIMMSVLETESEWTAVVEQLLLPRSLQLFAATTEPMEALITTVLPSTLQPTSLEPTTLRPTTVEPTTLEPTTEQPTTTLEPTTQQPTTIEEPTTQQPTTTVEPTTQQPTTTEEPTTQQPTTTEEPTTQQPTTTVEPTTEQPTTTVESTTEQPTTSTEPTTQQPTATVDPTTVQPTTYVESTTLQPTTTVVPTTQQPSAYTGPTAKQPTTSFEPPTQQQTSLKPITQQQTSLEYTSQERTTNVHPSTQQTSTNLESASPYPPSSLEGRTEQSITSRKWTTELSSGEDTMEVLGTDPEPVIAETSPAGHASSAQQQMSNEPTAINAYTSGTPTDGRYSDILLLSRQTTEDKTLTSRKAATTEIVIETLADMRPTTGFRSETRSEHTSEEEDATGKITVIDPSLEFTTEELMAENQVSMSSDPLPGRTSETMSESHIDSRTVRPSMRVTTEAWEGTLADGASTSENFLTSETTSILHGVTSRSTANPSLTSDETSASDQTSQPYVVESVSSSNAAPPTPPAAGFSCPSGCSCSCPVNAPPTEAADISYYSPPRVTPSPAEPASPRPQAVPEPDVRLSHYKVRQIPIKLPFEEMQPSDERPVAIAIGSVAIATMASFLAVILVVDATSLWRDLLIMRDNLSSGFRFITKACRKLVRSKTDGRWCTRSNRVGSARSLADCPS